MRLHEEYITRNNPNAKFILYEKRSNVFLRKKKTPYEWSIFSIVWRTGHHSPGSFEISLLQPVLNGYKKRDIFQTLWTKEFVQWDNYADVVMDFIDNTKLDWIAASEKERTLSLWQMFLQIYDEWLATNADFETQCLIEKSIRPTNDLDQRESVFKDVYNRLDDEVKETLDCKILPMAKGHSYWLEKLINV